MKNIFVLFILVLFVLASSCTRKKEEVKINKQSKPDSTVLTNYSVSDSQEKRDLNSAGEEEIKILKSDEAKSHIDENAIVRGYVAAVVKRENVAYLNFDKKYPKNTFTAVVFAEKFSEFDDLNIYQNQNVEVKGFIKLYRGKPEIILSSKNQIKIIK